MFQVPSPPPPAPPLVRSSWLDTPKEPTGTRAVGEAWPPPRRSAPGMALRRTGYLDAKLRRNLQPHAGPWQCLAIWKPPRMPVGIRRNDAARASSLSSMYVPTFVCASGKVHESAAARADRKTDCVLVLPLGPRPFVTSLGFFISGTALPPSGVFVSTAPPGSYSLTHPPCIITLT